MNPDLEALVLAFEAVTNAAEGDEAKRLAAHYQSQVDQVLRRHPGLDAVRLERWVKAQKRFPSV